MNCAAQTRMKIKEKRIDKVLRDPEFDNIADNEYLSNIGTIAMLLD